MPSKMIVLVSTALLVQVQVLNGFPVGFPWSHSVESSQDSSGDQDSLAQSLIALAAAAAKSSVAREMEAAEAAILSTLDKDVATADSEPKESAATAGAANAGIKMAAKMFIGLVNAGIKMAQEIASQVQNAVDAVSGGVSYVGRDAEYADDADADAVQSRTSIADQTTPPTDLTTHTTEWTTPTTDLTTPTTDLTTPPTDLTTFTSDLTTPTTDLTTPTTDLTTPTTDLTTPTTDLTTPTTDLTTLTTEWTTPTTDFTTPTTDLTTPTNSRQIPAFSKAENYVSSRGFGGLVFKISLDGRVTGNASVSTMLLEPPNVGLGFGGRFLGIAQRIVNRLAYGLNSVIRSDAGGSAGVGNGRFGDGSADNGSVGYGSAGDESFVNFARFFHA